MYTQIPRGNPHAARLVVASMSYLHPMTGGHGDACKLVGRTANGFNYTDDVLGSWIAVDLGPKRTMHVAHYCLRHGGFDRHALGETVLRSSQFSKSVEHDRGSSFGQYRPRLSSSYASTNTHPPLASARRVRGVARATED